LLLLIELLQTLKLIELPEEQEEGCDDDKGLLLELVDCELRETLLQEELVDALLDELHSLLQLDDMLQKLDEWLLSELLGLWQDAMYELDEVADDSELNDGELQDILQDTIDEEVHELLKLDETLLKLEEWKQLLHDMLFSDEHKELELLESVLSDEQLDEKLLLLVLDMLLVQLELIERLLKLQLSSLEDEQRQDEDGEAHDELVDSEHSDKDNDEQLEDRKLEELQQLKLLDTELTMDDKELLDELGLMKEEDGEMQDELIELELSD